MDIRDDNNVECLIGAGRIKPYIDKMSKGKRKGIIEGMIALILLIGFLLGVLIPITIASILIGGLMIILIAIAIYGIFFLSKHYYLLISDNQIKFPRNDIFDKYYLLNYSELSRVRINKNYVTFRRKDDRIYIVDLKELDNPNMFLIILKDELSRKKIPFLE